MGANSQKVILIRVVYTLVFMSLKIFLLSLVFHSWITRARP
jgi:hypothetical protein